MVQPGSQCRIKVLVSDGFHTTELTSDPFTVPDLGPQVGIDTPDQNAVINTFPATFQRLCLGRRRRRPQRCHRLVLGCGRQPGQRRVPGRSEPLVGRPHRHGEPPRTKPVIAASATVRITVNGGTAQAGVYLPTMVKP